MKHLLSCLAAFSSIILLTACNDVLEKSSNLTKEQQELIGKGVKFDISVENMKTTKVYNMDGFNYGDLMYIFRQAYKEDGVTFEKEEDWKSYKFNSVVDPSTGLVLFSQWEINTDAGGGFRGTTQSPADSIFWENGKSVRFRAYAKSTLYDDYMYANYVNVSGPVGAVPLNFKHLGCRIGFSPLAGNELNEIIMCTEPEYYKRKDNAELPDDDLADMYSDAEAEQIAANVKAVYEKICMVGGLAMYSDADNNRYSRVDGSDVSDPTAQYGKLTAKKVGGGEVMPGDATAENTIRPDWKTSIDGSRYMVCIPYEMGENLGSTITLPKETRFRIKLYEVNNSTNSYNENEYHLLNLSDAVDAEGNKVYEDGLVLRAGYSYMFHVGYKYGKLVVKSISSLDWTENPNIDITGSEISNSTYTADYNWWKVEMDRACEAAINSADGKFTPEFTIKNMNEYLGFINIVSGTVPQPTGDDYTACIAYNKYHPQNGGIEKYEEATYLTEAFSFKDYVVNLTCDLDFEGQTVPAVGSGTPIGAFQGSLDCKGHVFKNFNGTIFKYLHKAAVTGLEVRSNYKVTVAENVNESKLSGILVVAPSDCAIAKNSTKSIYKACSYISFRDGNGPMFNNGSGNEVYGCFAAAKGNGIIVGSASFAEFEGCYFDKTLAPCASTVPGMDQASDDFLDCKIRGVITSALKAVEDNLANPNLTNIPYDKYYGVAPYKVMNEAKGEIDYEYVVSAFYNDRYPVLKLK